MENWPYPDIFIATSNQHKVKQFADLFHGLGLQVKSLVDLNHVPEIHEDQDSFEGNAIKKAETISRARKIPVIADDSGLVIPALDGAPGIYSARFAGSDADDEKNNRKLIEMISKIPIHKRSGKFVCIIALAIPDQKTYIFRGECSGIILDEPRGCYGFGYDPLFFLPGEGKTMAEILPEQKNIMSHRAIATKKCMELLKGKYIFEFKVSK